MIDGAETVEKKVINVKMKAEMKMYRIIFQ